MPTAPPTEGRGKARADDCDLNLMDALAQLSFMVQGALAKRAADQDLSLIQTRLLGVLRDRRPTMQEVAQLLELDKSSVTGLINRAERRGLVQRSPSSEDRRSVHVTLSPVGRRVAQKVVRAFQHDIDAATAHLTKAERDRLRQLAASVVAEAG